MVGEHDVLKKPGIGYTIWYIALGGLSAIMILGGILMVAWGRYYFVHLKLEQELD